MAIVEKQLPVILRWFSTLSKYSMAIPLLVTLHMNQPKLAVTFLTILTCHMLQVIHMFIYQIRTRNNIWYLTFQCGKLFSRKLLSISLRLWKGEGMHTLLATCLKITVTFWYNFFLKYTNQRGLKLKKKHAKATQKHRL